MADPYGKLQKQIASLGPGTEFLESLYNDMISSGELDPNTTYEEFVAMDPLNTFDIDREQRAGGGMMDINDMTKPLKKYEHGGLHGGSSDTESLKFFPPTTSRTRSLIFHALLLLRSYPVLSKSVMPAGPPAA